MAMFGNSLGSVGGSRLRGGDIRDELEQGVLGPIHFPRVEMPQFDPPPADASPARQPQRGGVVRGIAGSIGDFLLQNAGAAPIYAPQVRQNQILQQRQAEYARKRDDDWADFVRKAQFERENPKPVNNDTVADYNFIASQLGPDEAQQYLRNRADPIVNIPLPGGDVYMGPRSGMGALGGGASPAPAARPPENILQGGASTGLISPEEADVVRQSLGPNGQAAFDGWARENGVRVGKRLSNGQTAYFINGKWYDNPEGR